jgi:hypothetical protein
MTWFASVWVAFTSTGLASFGAWLYSAADIFWDASIFQSGTWSKLMNGMRVLLTMGGALLLLYEFRAKRLGERIPGRTKKQVAVLMTVLAFGVYFDFFNPNVRYREYYHRHEFYHYYLGSKFSDELGYNRIYECTEAAEMELGRASAVQQRDIRDLRENLIKPMTDPLVQKYIAECKPRFTPERWEAFKKDVDWFYSTMGPGDYWSGAIKDHGYNPPPVWTMGGKFFGSFGVADDGFFKVLSGIDVMLHLGTVLLLNWAFGWRVMAIATIFWGCNAPASFYWTGGAFIRQDWLFFCVASVCLARKRYFGLAGAALTWSSLLRVFPIILFAGWGLQIVFTILKRWRTGKGPWIDRDQRRLIAGCAIAGAVLIPASVFVTEPGSYKEFVQHTLKVHNNTPLTNHMGLETMIVHDWDGRMRFTRNDNLDDPFKEWKDGRLERLRKLKPVFVLTIAGLGLWIAWALRRTKLLWVGPALSLPLCVAMTNLTCYYYSMFMIAPALVLARRVLGPVLLTVAGASVVIGAMGTANKLYYWIDDNYAAQSWLFFLCGLLMLYAYSRPFSMERLKAWWDGKPEPRPKTSSGSTQAEAPAE